MPYLLPRTTEDWAFGPGSMLSGVTASATITAGQLLVVSGNGTVAPSTTNSTSFVGTAANSAASGAPVSVWIGGVQRLTASGTVTAGQTVQAAASGAAATHTDGTLDAAVVGVAITTATTGNQFDCLMTR
ncbi:MAG: DUF2190 family protein [Nocardioides sp.]|nr:DUF2190 family protein [Nocardioides sp.]